ncbi:MAG: response regulator [Acetobacteraceae bacterium]|nr:response regulator [Acetobacteraceae bacterium]
MPAGGESDRIYAERIDAVYSQMPVTLIATILNATLLALVLSPAAPAPPIWWWLAAVIVLSCIRLGIWYRHWTQKVGPEQVSRWALLAFIGSLLGGGIWGAGAALWFPPAGFDQLFLTLVIAGMCAGAATVYATHVPTAMAYIFPATLPLAVQFLLAGSSIQVVCGIMALIFACALCGVSFKFQRWFINTCAAQLKLSQRTHELDLANARLREEISSRQAAEARLRDSHKLEAIGRLTAGIAHDFNNLLLAISGVTELMAHQLGPNSEHAASVATILQTTGRAAALTRQLLAFGRKQPLSPKPTALNRVITDMEKLLRSTLGGRAEIVLNLDPNLAVALIDPEQLEHAILNVVINARDAMPEGGKVTVTTLNVYLAQSSTILNLPAGRYVAVAISDTGKGMAKDVLERAFDPFFTTKPVGEGSGLGLSQVHGLAHQSGGTATIESTPGEGTVVRIYLPAAPQSVIALPKTRRPGSASPFEVVHGSPNRQVLLVEDDEQVRHTTEAMLMEAGYRVSSVSDSSEALERIRSDPTIDILVADFAMPDMRGDEVATQIRQIRPNLPVLFITGYSDPEPLQDEPWVLNKPFTTAELTRMVEQALSRGAPVGNAHDHLM